MKFYYVEKCSDGGWKSLPDTIFHSQKDVISWIKKRERESWWCGLRAVRKTVDNKMKFMAEVVFTGKPCICCE